MRLVLTLLVKDEADIVDTHLAFHLNAGVDLVIATDHRSSDGTTEILERYARDGYLHLIREQREDFAESLFYTRMARMAATEFGADWVINSAADEFWWPRGADLKAVLSAIPNRYGVVHAFIRNFVPRPDDGGFFLDRMTVRVTPQAPINDPASPWRPFSKAIHRGDPNVNVSPGSHVVDTQRIPMRGWYPIEALHFGIRTAAQCARKAVVMDRAFASPGSRPSTGYHASAYRAVESDSIERYYATLALPDEDVARGLAEGSLAIDTRLRDAVRSLRDVTGALVIQPSGGLLEFPPLNVVDDAAYAVEIAALGDADVVRLTRRMDELERRVARAEQSPVARMQRIGGRIIRRLRLRN